MAVSPLDHWLSVEIRTLLEERFYARINQQARLEILSQDPEFLRELNEHVGLFADHGVVHVRDVAQQFLKVLSTSAGLLIPGRDPQRLRRVQGLGVLMAYIHDIGMVDFSSFGRTMHPEFAAQAVFDPEHEDILDRIWLENSGNLAWLLTRLAEAGKLPGDPGVVLRELLALSYGHSKSKMSITVLNDPARLRSWMQQVIQVNLYDLYCQKQVELGVMPVGRLNPGSSEDLAQASEDQVLAAAEVCQNPHLARFYKDISREAFAWLVDPSPEMQALAQDATDAVRLLRVADALRQRGTVLATSGSYEVFVDHQTGHAVYSLRHGPDRLFLLEIPHEMSAGEANIASSEIDPDGDLRIAFHRGAFFNPGAVDYAARCAALVVNDIEKDVIESFVRPQEQGGWLPAKPASQMSILLEETEDNPNFTRTVSELLTAQAPQLRGRVQIVPSLKAVTPLERQRYQNAAPLDWPEPLRQDLLRRLKASGHPTGRIDLNRAFDHVRLITLEPGEMLLEAGAPASLVYIPLDMGLKILRQGGYLSLMVEPWMFLGHTGVIRGAERNATIVAEQPVRLLAIPKLIYLRYWHNTLSPEEFRAAIAALHKGDIEGGGAGNLLEKTLLLQKLPFFDGLEAEALFEIAGWVQLIDAPAGQRLCSQGEAGDSLFIVVGGALEEERDGQATGSLALQDLFGVAGGPGGMAYRTTVTAKEDSRLLRLDREASDRLIAQNSHFARAVIDLLARLITGQ